MDNLETFKTQIHGCHIMIGNLGKIQAEIIKKLKKLQKFVDFLEKRVENVEKMEKNWKKC